MSECSIPAQYRLRVKQRMAIVAFAREHGIKPASRHFGFARRTVRTWLRRWKAEGETGLVPKYPRQRKRRLPATTIDLIRVARTEHQLGRAAHPRVARARPRAAGQRANDSARVLRHRRASPDEDAASAPSADEAVREGASGRLRPGGRQSRQAGEGEGLSVHRIGRLHADARASALPETQSPRQPRFSPRVDATRFRSPFGRFNATTGRSSRSRFNWPWRPPACATATSSRVVRSRTGKSSAVIASTARNSGAATNSRTESTRSRNFASGSAGTTMSASRWRSPAERRLRSWLRVPSRALRQARHLGWQVPA